MKRRDSLTGSGAMYSTAWPYLGSWLQDTLTRGWVAKLTAGIYAAVLIEVHDHLARPLLLALGFWMLDWLAGVLRALFDPEIEVDLGKAGRAVLKPLIITITLLSAAGIEAVVRMVMSYDLEGRAIVVLASAICIEEAFSIHDHAASVLPRAAGALGKILRWVASIMQQEREP